MGDASSGDNIGKMLIFSLVFISCFIALIALIPSEFYASSKDYTQFKIPDYFTVEDVEYVKHFLNYSLIEGDWVWFDFNTASNPVNYKVLVLYFYEGEVYVKHVCWEWWIFYTVDDMMFDTLTPNREGLVAGFDSEINATVDMARCPHLSVKVWFFDTNGTRNDIGEAWDDNELGCGIGFGASDYETKLQAWDIVGRLLTFQSPEIFGFEGEVALALNLVFGLPFWACVAYIIYRLVLMAIPFL